MTTAHIRLKKADGSFQYDSDLGTAYYRSAAVIQTQPRFRSNTSASTAYVPININDDSLVAVWAYGAFARGGSTQINGQWYELYQTNMPVGANFYYWVLGKATELPNTGMIRTKNAQNQITFTSDKPPMVGVGILGGANGTAVSYEPGRQYAAVMPSFSGRSRVVFEDAGYYDENTKPPKMRYDGYMDGKLYGLQWNGAAFEQVEISWNDISLVAYDQKPATRTEYDLLFQGALIIDITATGQLAIGGSPPPAATVAFSSAPPAHESQDTGYTFSSFGVTVTGGASPVLSYSWSLSNTSGGTWTLYGANSVGPSVSVLDVVGQANAQATLTCTVTLQNGQTATGSMALAHKNTAPAGSNVSVSLAGQSGSGRTNIFVFGSATPNISGGTPSSYNWSISNALGGSWSVANGQGTNTASIRVSSVIADEESSATINCSMVINGTTYVASAAFSYYRYT